jgi:hypothetical protein
LAFLVVVIRIPLEGNGRMIANHYPVATPREGKRL